MMFCFYNEDFYHHCDLKYKDVLNVIRLGDFEEVFTAVSFHCVKPVIMILSLTFHFPVTRRMDEHLSWFIFKVNHLVFQP